MKKALITGVTGQDGSYLAELLLSKGYEVHGLMRRTSTFNRHRIHHVEGVITHYGDLTDASSIWKIVHEVQPDEVYHLGAQSNVNISFDMPGYTSDTNAMGTISLLEACKSLGTSVKFYMAASSEMFGATPPPQNEESIFWPRSVYAITKLYGYEATRLYRDAYKMFASNGILFNHESERRGENFVTRKVTVGVAKIKAGLMDKMYMGNLDAKRDWGYAPEYVEAMWMMLQHDTPDDFVIATGKTHTVKEFVQEAFTYAGLGDWKKYVMDNDPRFVRPAEVDALAGDPAKAKKILAWEAKISFTDLVKIMVDLDMKKFGVSPPGEGLAILEKHFPNRFWKQESVNV